MNALKAILLYLVVVVLTGAVLAPWAFHGIQWLATFEWLEWLGRYPFRRIFNRSVLVVALIGLWPLWRALGIRTWSAAGYPREDGWWRQVLQGMGVGIVSLVAAVLLARRPLQFDRTALEVGLILVKLSCTAVAVALIEETFFRGGLQGALQRGMQWRAAVAISSAIYSTVHFLRPGGKILADQVDWSTGFVYLGQLTANSFRGTDVFVGFVSLFLAGALLGWLYYQTGSLYWPLGVHGGWVLANEFVRWLGGGRIISQPVTWVVLMVVWLALARRWRRAEFPLPA